MPGNAGGIRAGKAFVEFYANDAELQKGLAAVQKKLNAVGAGVSKVGSAMAAVGGVVTSAFTAAATAFATTGAALDDMSKRTGLGVEALSELKYAAEQSGSNLETVEKALRGMSKSLFSAGNGSPAMLGALNDIGVSLDSLQGKSPDQQFQILSEAIARIEDPSTRAAVAMKVFGKAGSDLLPMFSEGKAGIAALRAEAHELGVTMSSENATAAAALDDAMAKLKTQMGAVFVQIGAAVAGPLTEFFDYVSQVTTTTIEWAGQNKDLVAVMFEVGAGLAGVGTATYAVGKAFSVVASAAGGANVALGFLVAHPAIAGVTAIVGTVAWLTSEFYAAHDAVTVFDDALKKLNSKQTSMDPREIQTLATRYDQLAAKVRLTKEEQQEAAAVMSKLRDEFGALGSGFEGDRIVGADAFRAKLQTARQGQSFAVQSGEVNQAKAAFESRKLEGADAGELAERLKAIKQLEADLAQTNRIVGDAKPTAFAGPPAVQQARAAMHSDLAARVAPAAAGMAAAVANYSPVSGPGAAAGVMTMAAERLQEKIFEVEKSQLEVLREIATQRSSLTGGA